MKKFKKIGLVVTHPGALAALRPVEKVLASKNYQTIWFSQAGEKAAEKLGDAYTEYSQEQTDFPAMDVLVAGVRGLAPGVELFMAQKAKSLGIPVIKVLDFWGSGMPHEKGFAPDRLCVLDQGSVAYEAYISA